MLLTMIRSVSPARLALLLLPVFVFLLVYAVYRPAVQLIQPDSESYLIFSPLRTGGYSGFLALFRPLLDGPAGYVPIQLALFALCMVMLGWQLHHGIGTVFAVGAEVVLLINPFVNAFHFTIMTESIFISATLLLLAAVLQHLRTDSRPALAVSSLLVGILITIRPTGIAFLPVLILLAFCRPRRPAWRQALLTILPCLLVIAAEAGYYQATHAQPRESLAHLHIFAKGGLVDVADPAAIIDRAPDYRRPLDLALENDLRPVRRLIDAAPDLPALCHLLDNYENFAQSRFDVTARRSATAVGGTSAEFDAGLARIQAAPLSFAKLSLRHLACLWTFWITSATEKSAFLADVESRRPLPFEDVVLETLAIGPTQPFAAALRIVLVVFNLVCLLAALLLAIVLLRRRRPSILLALAGLAGTALQASMVFTAVGGLSIPRYPLSLWPLLMIGTGAFLWWVLRLRTPAVP